MKRVLVVALAAVGLLAGCGPGPYNPPVAPQFTLQIGQDRMRCIEVTVGNDPHTNVVCDTSHLLPPGSK